MDNVANTTFINKFGTVLGKCFARATAEKFRPSLILQVTNITTLTLIYNLGLWPKLSQISFNTEICAVLYYGSV